MRLHKRQRRMTEQSARSSLFFIAAILIASTRSAAVHGDDTPYDAEAPKNAFRPTNYVPQGEGLSGNQRTNIWSKDVANGQATVVLNGENPALNTLPGFENLLYGFNVLTNEKTSALANFVVAEKFKTDGESSMDHLTQENFFLDTITAPGTTREQDCHGNVVDMAEGGYGVFDSYNIPTAVLVSCATSSDATDSQKIFHSASEYYESTAQSLGLSAGSDMFGGAFALDSSRKSKTAKLQDSDMITTSQKVSLYTLEPNDRFVFNQCQQKVPLLYPGAAGAVNSNTNKGRCGMTDSPCGAHECVYSEGTVRPGCQDFDKGKGDDFCSLLKGTSKPYDDNSAPFPEGAIIKEFKDNVNNVEPLAKSSVRKYYFEVTVAKRRKWVEEYSELKGTEGYKYLEPMWHPDTEPKEKVRYKPEGANWRLLDYKQETGTYTTHVPSEEEEEDPTYHGHPLTMTDDEFKVERTVKFALTFRQWAQLCPATLSLCAFKCKCIGKTGGELFDRPKDCACNDPAMSCDKGGKFAAAKIPPPTCVALKDKGERCECMSPSGKTIQKNCQEGDTIGDCIAPAKCANEDQLHQESTKCVQVVNYSLLDLDFKDSMTSMLDFGVSSLRDCKGPPYLKALSTLKQSKQLEKGAQVAWCASVLIGHLPIQERKNIPERELQYEKANDDYIIATGGDKTARLLDEEVLLLPIDAHEVFRCLPFSFLDDISLPRLMENIWEVDTFEKNNLENLKIQGQEEGGRITLESYFQQYGITLDTIGGFFAVPDSDLKAFESKTVRVTEKLFNRAEDQYRRFLWKYGTHYSSKITLGGSMTSESYLSKKRDESSSETSSRISASLSAMAKPKKHDDSSSYEKDVVQKVVKELGLGEAALSAATAAAAASGQPKLGGSIGYSSSTKKSASSESTEQGLTMHFEGGEVFLGMSNDYNGWVKSIMKNPAVIAKQMTPITNLLRPPVRVSCVSLCRETVIAGTEFSCNPRCLQERNCAPDYAEVCKADYAYAMIQISLGRCLSHDPQVDPKCYGRMPHVEFGNPDISADDDETWVGETHVCSTKGLDEEFRACNFEVVDVNKAGSSRPGVEKKKEGVAEEVVGGGAEKAAFRAVQSEAKRQLRFRGMSSVLAPSESAKAPARGSDVYEDDILLLETVGGSISNPRDGDQVGDPIGGIGIDTMYNRRNLLQMQFDTVFNIATFLASQQKAVEEATERYANEKNYRKMMDKCRVVAERVDTYRAVWSLLTGYGTEYCDMNPFLCIPDRTEVQNMEQAQAIMVGGAQEREEQLRAQKIKDASESLLVHAVMVERRMCKLMFENTLDSSGKSKPRDTCSAQSTPTRAHLETRDKLTMFLTGKIKPDTVKVIADLFFDPKDGFFSLYDMAQSEVEFECNHFFQDANFVTKGMIDGYCCGSLCANCNSALPEGTFSKFTPGSAGKDNPYYKAALETCTTSERTAKTNDAGDVPKDDKAK